MPNDDRIVMLNESSLKNIANSIRNKTETTDAMYPSEMSTLIDNIKVGGRVKNV